MKNVTVLIKLICSLAKHREHLFLNLNGLIANKKQKHLHSLSFSLCSAPEVSVSLARAFCFSHQEVKYVGQSNNDITVGINCPVMTFSLTNIFHDWNLFERNYRIRLSFQPTSYPNLTHNPKLRLNKH